MACGGGSLGWCWAVLGGCGCCSASLLMVG